MQVVELDGPAGDRLFFWLFFHRFCLQWQLLQFSVLVILAASTGFLSARVSRVLVSMLHATLAHILKA